LLCTSFLGDTQTEEWLNNHHITWPTMENKETSNLS
jgi:hypothetical protein